MAKRRRGDPIHGWLNVDKPAGMTSTAVVGAVRRLTNAAKVGHGGTLDPLATGVLPIALGEATKTVAYVMDGEKEYEFTVRWGEERDTDDAEGQVTAVSDLRPCLDAITAALPQFIGDIEQSPPAFSALKVDGERAYDAARRGEALELAPRTVTVHRLQVAHHDPESGETRFHLACGKGTYVRAIARDLGRFLGCRGYVTALRRTRVGPFRASAAISLDKLNDFGHSAPPEKGLLTVATALDDIPALAITAEEANRLKSGQVLRVPSRKTGVVQVWTDDTLVALGDLSAGVLKPLRIFNL